MAGKARRIKPQNPMATALHSKIYHGKISADKRRDAMDFDGCSYCGEEPYNCYCDDYEEGLDDDGI